VNVGRRGTVQSSGGVDQSAGRGGGGGPIKVFKLMKGSLGLRIIVAVAVLALAGGGGYWAWRARHPAKSLFRTGTVRQGNLVAVITATGTIEPEERVDVGAQVAGLLVEFGKDQDGNDVDYTSVVKEDGLLARIDDTLYAADVALAQAQVAQDEAGEQRAAADLEQMKAKAAQAEADWKRAQMLGPSEALAPTTYDSYKANYEIAKANVDLDVAAVAQAKASTLQAEATLSKAKQQLKYCVIKSPVNGVIIDRRVNLGETVVSSLNSPSLFLIAKDLTHIQVWASVNEADIGNIHPGQPVTFTVDAYANRVFRGTVNKVRLNATMTQNVVTYTVEVNANNQDGKLLTYMTANVRFLTGEATNALLVLNSALRWRPQNDLIAPEFRQSGGAGRASAGARASDRSGALDEGAGAASGGGRRGGERGGGGPEAVPMQTGTLWAKNGTFVRPMPVKLGLTDGTWTEVQGEGLAPGTIVVMGTQSAEAAADATTPEANPFLPQMGRRGGPGGGAGGGGGGGRRGGG